jgi:hypothetical protein
MTSPMDRLNKILADQHYQPPEARDAWLRHQLTGFVDNLVGRATRELAEQVHAVAEQADRSNRQGWEHGFDAGAKLGAVWAADDEFDDADLQVFIDERLEDTRRSAPLADWIH